MCGADRWGVSSIEQGQGLSGHYGRLSRTTSSLTSNRDRSPRTFKTIHPCLFLTTVYQWRFSQRKSLRRRAEPVVASQQGASRPDMLKRSAVQIEKPAPRYGARFYSQVLFPQGILTLVLSSGKRALAGLYLERLQIAPPPARLQGRVRKRRRTRGTHRELLRQRMRTGCLPPIPRCRVP